MSNHTSLQKIQKIPNKATRSFLVKVWNQIHRENRDCIIAVCGGTGSGKSMIALWLAEMLDCNYKGESRFTIDRIVFGFSEWAKVLQNDSPAGTAIIMEEPQAYFNSRTFNSKANLDAVIKFSTGRVFRYLYILTYPSFERIDSQLRERVHYLIATEGIDKDRNMNKWVPLEIILPWRPNEPLIRRRLSFIHGHRRQYWHCESPLASPELLLSYKEKSKEWKSLVRKGKVDTSGNIVSDVAEEDEVDPVQEIIDKYDLPSNAGLTQIMGLTGLTRSRAYEVYARLKYS